MSLPGLPDLRQRSREPELLDGTVSDVEVGRSLADLRLVNRWLGGRRHLLAAVRPHLEPGGSLLDVGCGSADLPVFLLSRLQTPVLAVGLDVKPAHLQHAPPVVRRVVAHAGALPFADGAFDVVTASLFLHHFDARDLVPVLVNLYRLARRALVVSDLHRAAVPHLFGRLVFPALFRSPVSVHDGLVSIRRGFRPPELRSALEEAGITHVRIRRRFPYRLLAVAVRPGDPGGAGAGPGV
ncbi:MAG: methyltransferase domain-containing protein [Acidobacteria bacterium]|nr:methyltransferase domain-containing protein [Acidobacteriota bacterium]